MKKFNEGEKVTLKQYLNNGFKRASYDGEYYTESNGIESHLIEHGSLRFVDGKGEVITYNNGYVIVKFYTSKNEFVQLGFDEKDLILLNPGEQQFKFIM